MLKFRPLSSFSVSFSPNTNKTEKIIPQRAVEAMLRDHFLIITLYDYVCASLFLAFLGKHLLGELALSLFELEELLFGEDLGKLLKVLSLDIAFLDTRV